jgi:hypothetical protein
LIWRYSGLKAGLSASVAGRVNGDVSELGMGAIAALATACRQRDAE